MQICVYMSPLWVKELPIKIESEVSDVFMHKCIYMVICIHMYIYIYICRHVLMYTFIKCVYAPM